MSIPDRAGHKDGNAPKRVLACAAPTLAAHKWLSVGFAKTSFIYMCESHHTQQLALTWPGSAAEPGAQHSQGKLRQQVGAAGPGRSSSLPVGPGTTHRLLSSTHILGGSQAEPTRAANTARAPLPPRSQHPAFSPQKTGGCSSSRLLPGCLPHSSGNPSCQTAWGRGPGQAGLEQGLHSTDLARGPRGAGTRSCSHGWSWRTEARRKAPCHGSTGVSGQPTTCPQR